MKQGIVFHELDYYGNNLLLSCFKEIQIEGCTLWSSILSAGSIQRKLRKAKKKKELVFSQAMFFISFWLVLKIWLRATRTLLIGITFTGKV